MPYRGLVFTDLDGTFMNHHSYDANAAIEKTQVLEDLAYCVIYNTSKTFSELAAFNKQIDRRQAFICENGGAIALPIEHSLNVELPYEWRQVDGYMCLSLGQSAEYWQQVLSTLDQSTQASFQLLSQMSDAEVVAATGLNLENAQAAKRRDFGQPLLIHDTTAVATIKKTLAQHDGQLVQGGRFYHAMGAHNKALAMRHFATLVQQTEPLPLIALGDSLNDAEMLQHADIAIIVDSPNSDLLDIQHPHLIRTEQSAPLGWCEGIDKALDLLNNL